MDPAEARELLTNAVQSDLNSGAAPFSPDDESGPAFGGNNPAASTQSSSEVVEGTTGSDSFTRTDLAALVEGLDDVSRERVERAYKAFQGDYTREKQSLAEQRKAFEGIEDPGAAREALQFVEQLQNDPQYALAVHSALSEELQRAGLTPAQANAAAAQQMDDFSSGDVWEGEDDYGVVPPEVLNELNELKQWRQTMEQERAAQQWEAELNRQTMAIRQSNPQYTDADMDSIYQLAWSTEGDLFKAQAAYDNIIQANIGRYLDQKGQVPGGEASSTGHAEQPRSFSSVEDAHKAAREAWIAAQNAEGGF